VTMMHAVRSMWGNRKYPLRTAANSPPRRVPHPRVGPARAHPVPQVAQTLSAHHGALAYLLGINALRASEAATVKIEDYADTLRGHLRGHRVLHLVGKGNKPATMPLTVPVLRVLDACRGQRTCGPLVLRLVSGQPIDPRDAYRMVARIVKAAGSQRHISPHSLWRAAANNAVDAGVPLRDAQILARHADPRTTEHYDRPRQPSTDSACTSVTPTSPASDKPSPTSDDSDSSMTLTALVHICRWALRGTTRGLVERMLKTTGRRFGLSILPI